MADQYLPGAERHLTGNGGTMDGTGGARVVWHYTGDRDASPGAPQDLVPFGNLIGWFTDSGKGYAPHILWDPFTGRFGQFIPAGQSSRALVNLDGGVQTNRKGNACIQVETLFFPYCRWNGRVYATIADTPRKGLPELMAWLRSWGVPDQWPMGLPNGGSQRNAGVWDSRSGHYGHSQVPENNHTDPGPMGNIFNTVKDVDMPLTQDDANLVAMTIIRSGTPNLVQEIARAVSENPTIMATAAQVAGLAAAGGVTQAQLNAAAEAGARAALAVLGHKLTD